MTFNSQDFQFVSWLIGSFVQSLSVWLLYPVIIYFVIEIGDIGRRRRNSEKTSGNV